MNALTFRRLALAVAVLFAGVAGNASGQLQYKLTDLGTLPGDVTSWATGINFSGEVVGSSWNGAWEGGDSAFLYSNGSMQSLGTLSDYPGGSAPSSINDSGQVVGLVDSGEGAYIVADRAFLYSGGTMQDLGTLLPGNAMGSIATAINNNGQVVGYFGTGLAGSIMEGFVTSGGGNQGISLVPSSSWNRLNAINDSGQAVGAAVNGSGYSQAFLFSGGTMESLGTLPGYPYSSADGINASGQIVGSASNGNITHAFLLSGGPMQDLGTLGGDSSQALGINDSRRLFCEIGVA